MKKTEEQRLKHNEGRYRWAAKNKAKVAAAYKKWQRGQSAFVWSLKEGKCCIFCGESHPACLDFHHRDKNDKKGNIQQIARSGKKDTVLREIKKCDIVCSNCHRKIHYNEKKLL